MAAMLVDNLGNKLGLANLLIASGPTEVVLASVVAGKGPP
jgi:hypothetical protein